MLSKRDIIRELGKEINVFPLHPNNIKENSFNFTISHNAWTLGSGSIIIEDGKERGQTNFHLAKSGESGRKKYMKKGTSAIIKNKNKDFLVLLPHSTTIVETSEVIGVGSRIGGTLHSKVGIVAKGIGDIGTMLGPNFSGHLMLSLHNTTDEAISIPVGTTFVSLVFYYLDTPSENYQNSNMSGHVDKLAELGVEIGTSTREYLTEDWKCSVAGIRKKMCDSEAYKEFRKQVAKERFVVFKEYLTFRNISIAVAFLIFVLLAERLAGILDIKYHTTVWSERFWTVVLSGIVIPLIMAAKNLFKRR